MIETLVEQLNGDFNVYNEDGTNPFFVAKETISLPVNYRSCDEIINFNNAVKCDDAEAQTHAKDSAKKLYLKFIDLLKLENKSDELLLTILNLIKISLK